MLITSIEFRPIVIPNTLYKVITCIIADILKSVLHSICTESNRFCKELSYVGDIVLASEVLNGYHKTGLSPHITLSGLINWFWLCPLGFLTEMKTGLHHGDPPLSPPLFVLVEHPFYCAWQSCQQHDFWAPSEMFILIFWALINICLS